MKGGGKWEHISEGCSYLTPGDTEQEGHLRRGDRGRKEKSSARGQGHRATSHRVSRALRGGGFFPGQTSPFLAWVPERRFQKLIGGNPAFLDSESQWVTQPCWGPGPQTKGVALSTGLWGQLYASWVVASSSCTLVPNFSWGRPVTVTFRGSWRRRCGHSQPGRVGTQIPECGCICVQK